VLQILIDAVIGQTMQIILYDDDDPKKDDFLGRSANNPVVNMTTAF
jgi:hypothetical protein